MSAPRHEAEDPAALAAAVRAGHEADQVAGPLLWRAGIGFVVLLLVAMAAVYVIQPWMVARQQAEWPRPNPLLATDGRVEPPAPRLQVDPALDIHEQRKSEEGVLTTYGWVDRPGGVVRIPIERAMALLAERAGAAAQGQKAAPATGGGQP